MKVSEMVNAAILLRVGCLGAAFLGYHVVKKWLGRKKREGRRARREAERARREAERARREVEREYGVGVTPMEYAMFFPCARKPAWRFSKLGVNEVDIDMTPFIHKEDHIGTIIGYLDRTEKTLDICMAMITHKHLSEATLRAHWRGVQVQIITEYNHVHAMNSLVPVFINEGIPVATEKGSYRMHNTFVILDGNYCMMGSLNWTNQAIYGNWNHFVISNNQVHIGLMQGVFNALWDEFQRGREL